MRAKSGKISTRQTAKDLHRSALLSPAFFRARITAETFWARDNLESQRPKKSSSGFAVRVLRPQGLGSPNEP
jgi:hypothetical protein